MAHFVLTDTEDSGTTVGVFDSFEAAVRHAESIAPSGGREGAYTANVIERWDDAVQDQLWFRDIKWVYDGINARGLYSRGYYVAESGWHK